MLTLLILANLKLGIYLLGVLIFGSLAWLYFDALGVRNQRDIWLRAVGAILIAISYLVGAVMVDGVELGWTLWFEQIMILLRLVGYILLGLGVWSEAMPARPKLMALWGGHWSIWLLPILPGWVGLGYLRRASLGLERHLTKMAYGMYILAFAEILDLRRTMVGVNDIRIYEWVRDFGFLWIGQLVILFVGLMMVSWWVFGYLLRRFETQLSLFVSMLIIAGFVTTTSVYSYVMAVQLRLGVAAQVDAGGRMLQNNWVRLGDQLLREAESYRLIETKDKEALRNNLAKSEYDVLITDSEGRDLITGEKNEVRVEGVGYETYGSGSSTEIVLGAKIKREDGYVIVERKLADLLEDSALELAMGVRIYQDDVVIAASTIPKYPRIQSVLGLRRVDKARLGGVEYINTQISLKNGEGSEVAELETATPIMTVWSLLSSGLIMMYGLGIVILILMQLPILLVVRYLARQL